MAKIITEQTVVITFVITRGQLLSMKPWITKNTDPRPSIQNVGRAIPSVRRVRIVEIAWGRYPSTMQRDAVYPIMLRRREFMISD